ncbi:M23 family metallopeptidase [Streptomyces sp. WMMC1477]|uniref:M23 family metallopeptidase n=1 Tax=unclassified Streptomyces TaxID=2593676 RepID=UPI003FCDAB42
MASSRQAAETAYAGEESDSYPVYGPSVEDGATFAEWNPTADTVRPVRGRHRVAKQRSGMARSSAVLGVGMVAAIGAGGMATASPKASVPLSMPDMDLPGLDGLADGISIGGADDEAAPLAAPLTQAGLTDSELADGTTDAGEALRNRILAQADQQRAAADADSRRQAAAEAATSAAGEAEKKAEAEAAAEAAAEAERKRKAEEERRRKAEEERLRKLAASYTLPLANFQLTSGYGESGNMWSSDHTGQDFAAPTGTPVKAVHSGTIKEAGWAGAYGYRIVLELEDGTEIWYCHLSSMTRTSGTVTTGDTIGRVGSTGNSTGPHLHLEVRPGGTDTVDPLAWLRAKGLGI